jgi:uncharacterized protein (DUF885 family)
VRATRLGIHRHDGRLPELDRANLAARARRVERWLARLERIDREALPPDARRDHRILEYAMRAELHDLEEVRAWSADPMRYNRVLAEGVALLVDRELAPLDERLEALARRLEAYPRVIRAARRNLAGVPPLWAELAVESAEGTLSWLEQGVPAALEQQGLRALDVHPRARFRAVHDRALRHLRDWIAWLRTDLVPRADGDFRLGRDHFERKLRFEDHIELSVDELVEINERAIAEYRAWIEREAARIAPDEPAAEVVERIAATHPAADELIDEARRFVEEARSFVVSRGIVTLPADELPVVRPTPPYARSAFASMSAPGPFETGSSRAFYNVTNVDPSWSAERQAEHLTYFNRAGLLGISVHEVMPGHWVQLLYQRELDSDVRKVFPPGTLVEGWAHYTEQMMVDEGLGGGDPAVRIGQLRRALQRHARWQAAIALHTTDASIEDVARRFAETAFFAPFPALRETWRATYDPTYLHYAFGRMEILKLRQDWTRHKEERGEPASLGEFHDQLLRLGLPLPLAREALIPAGTMTGGRSRP